MELIKEQKECLSKVLGQYYFCANQTQKYWKRDNEAALKIQSKFKMYINRKQFLEKKKSAIKIQTIWRAFYAKKIFRSKKAKDAHCKNMKFFEQQAVTIQKMFRGFFVRKYIINFYARKEQLRALAIKNDEFRKELQEFGNLQAKQAEQYKQYNAQRQFNSLVKNLHHLSSTRNIPGVYNSPFAFEKPAVFDKTVEEHLKQGFKQSYVWRPPNRQDIMKHTIKSTGSPRKK